MVFTVTVASNVLMSLVVLALPTLIRLAFHGIISIGCVPDCECLLSVLRYWTLAAGMDVNFSTDDSVSRHTLCMYVVQSSLR